MDTDAVAAACRSLHVVIDEFDRLGLAVAAALASQAYETAVMSIRTDALDAVLPIRNYETRLAT